MPKYRIAEMLIDISSRYGNVARACEKYLAETDDAADFSVSADEDEILSLQKSYPEYSSAYAENMVICKKVTDEAAKRGVILFHSAAIEVDGRAYAFSAPSGTGKSTHIKLWRTRFGKCVNMINGDKPFLREKDGVFYVYGSPWCGKEGWNRNVSAPLAGVCFISRAEANTIRRISASEALPRVFAQLLKPPEAEGVKACLQFADRLISRVPIYHLACNISEEAAEVSFSAMTGKEIVK